MSAVILDDILASLKRAASYNPDVETAPAAILWTDKEKRWQAAIPKLQEVLPQLYVLGDYAPDRCTGPAIWLKCVEARTLPGIEYPEETIPIFYLPKVSRTELRLVNTCPSALQPLAELQYRGTYWSQKNGKDWTLYAFLTSKHGGLGLTIKHDQATQEALTRALTALLSERVAALHGRELQAADFDSMLDVRVERDMLLWLNDPEGTKTAWSPERWAAFASRVREALDFDPESDSAFSAVERLAECKDAWQDVWQRFAESASCYPAIPALLERAPLPTDLFADTSSYPAYNREQEDALRRALTELPTTSVTDARAAVIWLEADHARRRNWVWAAMGRARLTQALEHIHYIVQLTEQSFVAAIRPIWQPCTRRPPGRWMPPWWTLAAVESLADTAAVEAALKAIYVPWLEELATHFQGTVKAHGYPLEKPIETSNTTAAGLCVFFVDGLRFDAGCRLAWYLEKPGVSVEVRSSWATIPSVTASGKVLVSPVAVLATGTPDDREFEPIHRATKKPFKTDVLRKVLK
jgi:hypothetical protein